MERAGHEHPLARALARARDEHVAEAGNLPFFTAPPRARAAALLVHGFTASPWEMRPVASDLEQRGYACLAVRLPGHGTTPGDLARRRWEEWDAAVTQAFDLLAERFGRVYGVGLSTGALLLGHGGGGWPSATTIGLMLYITVVPMAVGNVAWFSIVGLLPARVAGLSSIMVPVVAMLTGALVHGEPLGVLQLAAMACCAAALALTLRR